MAKYRIEIDMGNEAFQDGAEGAEVAAILRDLADECEDAGPAIDKVLKDLNGNAVGTAKRK